jgi:hypothetical protein
VRTDQDVEFGVTLNATIDPRTEEARSDPSSGPMALQFSLTTNVGQEDGGAETATSDGVSFDAALRRGFGKLTAELGVGYDAPVHDRSLDTFRDHLELSSAFDLRSGRSWFCKSSFTPDERREDAGSPKRRLTPFLGIEQTVALHGPTGPSGRDFAVYYGVSYVHEFPHGITAGVKPFARWDHDLADTTSSIRGWVSHSVTVFKRACDVSLFVQFGHGTGHDDPQTAVVGVEFEMNL